MNRHQRRTLWQDARFTSDRTQALEQLAAFTNESLSIAIYSSTTWRPLIPFLQGELRAERYEIRTTIAEYESMSANIAAGTERYDAIMLAVDDPGSYGSLFDLAATFDEAESTELLSALLTRIDLLRERASNLMVLLPPIPPATPHGVASLMGRRDAFTVRLRAEIESRSGVEAIEPVADAAHFDARLWHLGRILYNESGFANLAESIAARLLLQRGRGIKALVVDLDDTLWGGVLGDRGAEGIELGDSYPGSCYRDFQRALLSWRRSGVLLALASKNDLDHVQQTIDTHEDMAIRSADVDHFEVHWQPKSESVGRILETFNIGPESLLFIDDNPRERADVASLYPEIAVFDFPDDPLDLCSRLGAVPWALYAGTSVEDSRREDLHKQQVERRAALTCAGTRETYLESLAMEVDIQVDCAADVPRVAQLHQKTNQFNMNAVRHGEADIARHVTRDDRHVLSLRYRDRFGDAGLVAAATVEVRKEDVLVPTLVLSCRVIGLGIEHCLLAAIQTLAPTSPIGVSYAATDRNGPARAFLDSLETVEDRSSRGRYWIQLPASVPGWITSTLKDYEHAL